MFNLNFKNTWHTTWTFYKSYKAYNSYFYGLSSRSMAFLQHFDLRNISPFIFYTLASCCITRSVQCTICTIMCNINNNLVFRTSLLPSWPTQPPLWAWLRALSPSAGARSASSTRAAAPTGSGPRLTAAASTAAHATASAASAPQTTQTRYTVVLNWEPSLIF